MSNGGISGQRKLVTEKVLNFTDLSIVGFFFFGKTVSLLQFALHITCNVTLKK